jgi:hypothetical protein
VIQSNYNSILAQVDMTNTLPQTLADGSVNPAWQARQREIEIQLAARTARMHNGDLCLNGTAQNCSLWAAQQAGFADMMAADQQARGRQYATRFLNVPEWPVTQPANPRLQHPTGDYFSLRCTDTLPASVTRGGLQMRPLSLQ